MGAVLTKLNLKDQAQIAILNAPPSFEPEIAQLGGVTVLRDLAGQDSSQIAAQTLEFVLCFVTEQRQINDLASPIAERTVGDAIVWFAYPKMSSRNYRCDFNRDSGWQALGAVGFEAVRQVAIDEDWSAIRFRRVDFIKKMVRKTLPAMTKEGKQRANKQQTTAGNPATDDAATAASSTRGPAPAALDEAVAWLETEAHRVIRAAKRSMADGTVAFPPQVGTGYEAFWLRDYAYTLEGAITAYSDAELTAACRLFVRSLDASNAAVDCVKFDGTPIYKPGFGSMGEHPVADGSQFTVNVAYLTYQKTKDSNLVAEIVDRLVDTMRSVTRNPATGLVHIDPTKDWDRCPYGFTDTVHKKGDLLFCSLLFVQASQRLSDLLEAAGRTGDARQWAEQASRVGESVRATLWDDTVGLFRAATVQCREHDIWGSAFAVFLGVADAAMSQRIAQYFKTQYDGIVRHGQIRHLPAGVYWEVAGERDQYQNGAYWATPTGWFVYSLALVDRELANQTIIDMVEDFRAHQACEWIVRETRKLPDYLASAALPLDGIRATRAL